MTDKDLSPEVLRHHSLRESRGLNRLPLTVSEMMPALHLLVVAAELVLTAYLIRLRISLKWITDSGDVDHGIR